MRNRLRWLTANAADGMRACLAEEFTDLYVFHLRGNQRTSGERSRKEGGKIFGSGSRAPIAISVFVKNPDAAEHGRIFFHDIGDYLDQKQKLAIIRDFGAVNGISEVEGWERITPDDQNDWLNQRDQSFDAFLAIGNKRGDGEFLFDTFSQGAQTARDAWCFNFSRSAIASNVQRLIATYDEERHRFKALGKQFPTAKARDKFAGEFVTADETKISWSRSLKANVGRDREIEFTPENVVISHYRPFSKQCMYFDRSLNEYVFKIPQIFPRADIENRVICTVGTGEDQSFGALMIDAVPEFKTHYNGSVRPFVYD